MSISKLRNSTAIDKVLGLGTVHSALKLNLGQGDQLPQDATANTASDHVTMYLRGVSENSTNEIDALISDLRGLREKLMVDGSRVEQEIVYFATLNQSILGFTKIVSEGIAQVKTSQATD